MKMKRIMAMAAAAIVIGLSVLPTFVRAQNTFSDLPRKETLILENPEGTVKNAGWFNIWAISGGGQSTGLHQVGMDTFWYIDPEKGLDGVWDNSLASDLHGADANQEPGNALGRRIESECGHRDRTRPVHSRLQAQETQLAVSFYFYGALQRCLDHAQACIRKAARPHEI